MKASDASSDHESSSPVRSTAVVTGDCCRFAGTARDRRGITGLTIILRGATTDRLRIAHEVGPDAPASWDLTLAIRPGITEAEVLAEDRAGNLSVLRRMLIARGAAAGGGSPCSGLPDPTPVVSARHDDRADPPAAERGSSTQAAPTDDPGMHSHG